MFARQCSQCSKRGKWTGEMFAMFTINNLKWHPQLSTSYSKGILSGDSPLKYFLLKKVPLPLNLLFMFRYQLFKEHTASYVLHNVSSSFLFVQPSFPSPVSFPCILFVRLPVSSGSGKCLECLVSNQFQLFGNFWSVKINCSWIGFRYLSKFETRHNRLKN